MKLQKLFAHKGEHCACYRNISVSVNQVTIDFTHDDNTLKVDIGLTGITDVQICFW